MHLDRLALQGFKSYAERVEIHFDPAIAVIIGSNGVGKSNALEAIVWALGEDELTSLRCSSQQDLLFAGSQQADPASEARVELTFSENGSEIAVSRTLESSGKETFRADGRELHSREEYSAALQSLGLDHSRNTVVRQEELTDFFTKTPEARRSYIGRFVSDEGEWDRLKDRFSIHLSELIPGSSAYLIGGHNGDNIDVEVAFPDKGPKRSVLLSGGERAVTGLALKLALFEMRPSPTYLLDEIEPALDWGRNHNMQGLLKALSQERQLIIVTHIRSTIQMAKTVHGVRVRADGSSWLKFHFLMDERLYQIYRCC